jgi:uncharacterized lipoprotein YmbA
LIHNLTPILGIGLVTALTGLVGCTGKIRYPNFYVLNVPARTSAANRTSAALGTVAVREFGAPAFLRGGPIVYRESPERLDFYAYHRWAVDPRQTVTGLVIQEMQSRGVFRCVDAFDGRGTPEFVLTGSIGHLEEVDQGAEVWVEVALSASLTSLRTGEVVWQGTSAKKAKLDQRSVPGVVAAMSREMGIAVEALVSSMLDRVSATAPAARRATSGQ